MSRAALAGSIALVLVGCGETVATYVLPSSAVTTLVVHGDAVTVVDRGAPLQFEPGGDPVTVLHYDRTLERLALSVEADGALRVAEPDAPREDVWPLPPPVAAAIYDGEAGAVIAADPRVAAQRVAGLRVPASACAPLERGASGPLDLDLSRDALVSLASIGETALLTTGPTSRSVDPTPRVYLIEGTAMRELTLDPPARGDARLFAFADAGAFFLAHTSTSVARTYRVARDGQMTRASETRSSTVSLDATAHWAGTTTVFGRLDGRHDVVRFDGTSGEWARVTSITQVGADARCDPYRSQQAFLLESPTSGIVGFPLTPLHRFIVGRGPQRVADIDLGLPCQSAFVRFPTGAELVTQLNGTLAMGVQDRRSAWRASDAEPWVETDFPIAPSGVVMAGDRVVAVDTFIDDVVSLEQDPLRPDQRPRLCGRLGVGHVRRVAFDGRQGVAVVFENSSREADLVRFSIRP